MIMLVILIKFNSSRQRALPDFSRLGVLNIIYSKAMAAFHVNVYPEHDLMKGFTG